MARFLDDLLRLLNQLRTPSTEPDRDSVSASPADSVNSLAESNDFRVIPHLLPFFAAGDSLSEHAARTIATLVRGLGPAQIAWLDEQARSCVYNYRRDDSWWTLSAAAVPRLAEIARPYPSAIGLLASHPRGYVRAAAVEALSGITTGDEIPFLALRANDWVEPIADRAAELLAQRLIPANRRAVLDGLPFIVRMLGQQRHDHSRFADATRTVLISDDGQELVERLPTYSSPVRRFVFTLVAAALAPIESRLFKAALADGDAVIRRRAVQGLAHRHATEAVADRLIRVLTRDRAPIVRKEALSVLADRLPDRALEVLRHALMDSSGRVRALAQFLARTRHTWIVPTHLYRGRLASASPLLVTAIEGLGETGSQEDFETVRRFLDAATPRVRRAALRAGARLDAERVVPLALEALSDSASSVRASAVAILTINRHRVDFDAANSRMQALADPRGRRKVLQLLREAPKWDAAVYLLQGLKDSDEGVRRAASWLLDSWVSDFNRSQPLATPQQLQRIRALLDVTAAELSEKTADLLRFTVDSR